MSKVQLRPGAFLKAVMFLCMLLYCCIVAQKCHAQIRGFITGSAGVCSNVFAAELHAGAVYNNRTVSVGYNVMPHAAAPALFQTRVGYVIANRVHVYAGAVRVMYSTDDKQRNYNTYNVGATVHITKKYYQNGGFFITANYSPRFVNVGVGMSFNLVKTEQ